MKDVKNIDLTKWSNVVWVVNNAEEIMKSIDMSGYTPMPNFLFWRKDYLAANPGKAYLRRNYDALHKIYEAEKEQFEANKPIELFIIEEAEETYETTKYNQRLNYRDVKRGNIYGID